MVDHVGFGVTDYARSKAFYEKAGFKEIGRRRECRMMGGKLWDEVHMDCISSEFESPVLRQIYAPHNE
jgi:catechol 2,3-dioxygenase-like lactoylglutathione lyase family enzyme